MAVTAYEGRTGGERTGRRRRRSRKKGRKGRGGEREREKKGERGECARRGGVAPRGRPTLTEKRPGKDLDSRT